MGRRDGHRLRVTPGGAVAAIALGAGLSAAALTVVAWVAGFPAVLRLLGAADWSWLPLAVFFVGLSHVGYTAAYREVVSADGGPAVSLRRSGVSVLAGFGVLVPRAGFLLDRSLWRDHGLSEQAAQDRVVVLAMLEYALLAPAAFAAAVVLLTAHFHAQPGVLSSWVIGVPTGSALAAAMLVLRRWLPKQARGWTTLHRGLDGIAALFGLLVSRRGVLATAGMAVYWLADIAALGAGLRIVQHSGTPIAALVVGYATGYALTRRSMPLAGAGAVEALMPFALYWLGVPLAAAVLAVLGYRLCNVWLPLVPAIFSVRHLQLTSRASEP
jgi:uncharacterized membrane protein YbhN (UPF0104 family)